MRDSHPSHVYTPGWGHRSNGINTFYHADWLGSTRWTSDITGNTFPQALRFDAFGNRSATGDPANWHPTDLQFAGGWGYQTEWASSSDPGLGLQYLEQRYYDPVVGRFMSPDPFRYAGGLNLYAYCGNDPVNCIDPDGLFWREILGIGGGVVGGLAGASAGGIGALPGAAAGAGLGAYIGSRLDGNPIPRAIGHGATDAVVTYGCARAGQAAFRALEARRAARAARAAREAATAAGRHNNVIGLVAEQRVSQLIGVARNVPRPGQPRVTIAGSGRGGFRVPEFDPAETIRLRGTIVEVKNVRELKLTPQIRDFMAEAGRRGVPLEIFTNGTLPARGPLARAIQRGDVIIRPIP